MINDRSVAHDFLAERASAKVCAKAGKRGCDQRILQFLMSFLDFTIGAHFMIDVLLILVIFCAQL